MSRALKIGRCIYCGTSEGHLSREHIIPFGLNGTWVLQEASCKKCGRITSDFEKLVLRGVFLPARTGLRFRTRRKLPDVYSLQYERDGQFLDANVLIVDCPAVANFPTFAMPASLDGREYSSGIDVNGRWMIQVAGPKVEETAKKLKTKTLRFTSTFEGHSFPRLIAKVAYGVAVADFGLDMIQEAYVLPAILGQSNDIGRWLGCDGSTEIDNPTYLHGVRMAVVNREIISSVRLFSHYGAPEYVVVVGRVAEGAQPGKFKL